MLAVLGRLVNNLGNFLKDLDSSKKGVYVAFHVAKQLIGGDPEELDKPNQIYGDFKIGGRNIEVKYDMYAKKSGNLCFEISNGKGPTGIFKTLSDQVYFVVPQEGNSFRVFDFNRERLVKWLQDESNSAHWDEKRGGDKKKFKMRLVKITTVIELGLCDNNIEVSDA